MSREPLNTRSDIAAVQRDKLDALLARVMATNDFYRGKFAPLGFDGREPPTHTDLGRLPYTSKHELVDDQRHHPPYGSNLSFPVGHYVRLHQTSGTTGRPLRWLDTAESWQWWLACWEEVYRAAGVTEDDRVFLAFSFGPFIGFWTAFEAGQRLGAMIMPGGGLSSAQRLETILANDATVLVCTPTYALRLAEVAREEGVSLPDSPVRVTIHAGEPGASIPNVRSRIETAWGARCVDHVGATEIGAWGYGCGEPGVVHVNEAEFLAEVIAEPDVHGSVPDPRDQRGELVLTNLGRHGSPVIRYRTGDMVHLTRGRCPCGRPSAVLHGGVIGRLDDMIVVRGVNVYPSAVENIIREFPAVDEFEVTVKRAREMSELMIRIEVGRVPDVADVVGALRDRMHRQLNLRPRVEACAAGTLPRYELKARRFKVDPG